MWARRLEDLVIQEVEIDKEGEREFSFKHLVGVNH